MLPRIISITLVCFGMAITKDTSAQDSIGSHYAPPIVLRPQLDHGISQPEAFDLNGDGRDDFVYSDIDQNFLNFAPLVLWFANDEGTMDLVTEVVIDGEVPGEEQGFRQHMAADFNGDGRLDLFLESHGPEPPGEPFPGGRNQLLLSNENGKWTNVSATHLPDLSLFTHGSTIGDFDGDGDLDIWVNEAGLLFSFFLYNDGQGKFAIVADNSVDWDDRRIVGRNGKLPDYNWLVGLWSDAIDADGDGDLDLAMGNCQVDLGNPELDFFNLLFVNDGSGSFTVEIEDSWPFLDHPDYVPYDPETEEWRGATNYQHSQVYDLNGDGLDDLLLHASAGDFSSSAVQMLISNGDGTFRDETHARINRGDPRPLLQDFYLRDLDGDGHADWFVWIGDNHGFLDVQINDGEGFFRPLRQDWATNGLLNGPGRYLDIDGDGDTDISEGMTIHKMIEPYGRVLDGTEIDDRLIGGAWDNVYRGMEGDDVLDGGLGNDSLDGGPGNDTLIGGKGDDTYVFHSADLAGDDTISDKAGFDRLKFDGFSLASVSQARQDEDGNLVLDFTSGGSLTVKDHFDGGNYGIEYLEAGGSVMPLSRDPSFTSGNIQSLLLDDFFINAGLNDAWVSDGAPFQGMFLTVLPLLKLAFAAWFTFDSKLPPQPFMANFGADDQRWITGLGTYEGNRAELSMELTSGGKFNTSVPLATQQAGYGTMTIEFSHCNLAGVQYDFPGAHQSGFMTVSRVVESNVPLCESLNMP